MKYNIFQGDLFDWAASYDGPPFHAMLCDPPYELGFMGRAWDASGVAFRPETWDALGRHLYPGAFGMAFAGSRGWHRMAVAIEDAGFVIHPTIFGWSYGSGFPKATRIDTQIDRAAGAERAVVGQRKHAPKFNAKAQGYREKDNGFNSRERTSFDETAPATDLARAWAGHRYGLQALKPALEPIIVFQKPYNGRPVDCIAATGAGALNIEAGRVGTEVLPSHVRGVARLGTFNDSEGGITPERYGRWPANLVLAHHPDCGAKCHPDCATVRIGEWSGESESIQSMRGNVKIWSDEIRGKEGWVGQNTERGHTDSGTAARFFYNAEWMLDRLDAADPVAYVAKPSTGEREAGLAAFPHLTVDDGRQTPIDNPYLRGETERRNTHATVKPIDLARYLATLLLPPPEYGPRRLLNPFTGSGTELIGAGIAGWEECQGIELEAEHVKIAAARAAHWVDIFGVKE